MQKDLVIEGDLTEERGNIVYEGGVIVTGSIEDGLRVECDGDIEVKGEVGSCTLINGGDINIRGGVRGDGTGRLICQGMVRGGYLVGVNVEARGDVMVSQEISGCRIVSNGRVIIVDMGGTIISSSIKAKDGIDAYIIGGEGGGEGTSLEVGKDFYLHNQLDELKIVKEKINELRRELEKLLGEGFLIGKLYEKLEGENFQIYHKAGEYWSQLGELSYELEEISIGIEETQDLEISADIIIHDTIYAGVSVRIGSIHQQLGSILKKVKITPDIENNELAFNKL